MNRVTVTLEKNDETLLVPFTLIELMWHGDEPKNSDDFDLIAYDGSSIPEFDFKIECGDRLQFTADWHTNYTKDYWGELDIDYWFENVTDITVWRVVYETPQAKGGDS